MTIKEMIEKINVYNEVASVIGQPKQALQINDFLFDTTCRMWTFTTNDYREMKKAIKDNYIEEFAGKLLDFENFEFEQEFRFGNTIIEILVVDK